MKTFISQKLVLLAVLAGMFGLSACTTTTNTVEPAQPVAQRQMLADKRVVTDTSLDSSCRILGVNAATGPGGFLKIQVEVQNLTKSRKSFTYRVEWFDENGMIINLPTTTAIPRSLEGKETASITATAPTDRAKDFRIRFLEPTR
jgi:uncharacterized protein YcfL